MGRIKTKFVKRISRAIYKDNSGECAPNFEKNKDTVMKLTDVKSKKIRNIVAGYLARLSKMQQ